MGCWRGSQKTQSFCYPQELPWVRATKIAECKKARALMYSVFKPQKVNFLSFVVINCVTYLKVGPFVWTKLTTLRYVLTDEQRSSYDELA